MTPQELKNSILQLAIQGKLVEQRPEEGTAEELYRQIQEEKKRLIKEGKTKKVKPLPEITEDEKPFDIPESWKWIRLDRISSLITKGTTPRDRNVSYDYTQVAGSSLYQDTFESSVFSRINLCQKLQEDIFIAYSDQDFTVIPPDARN